MFANLSTIWYTDRVSVYRSVNYKDGNLTKQKRELVKENIPCRIYQSKSSPPEMKTTASQVTRQDMMACSVEEDIQTGDELFVVRGGGLGNNNKPVRYFAGEPKDYYEPFGGVVPDLKHKEVSLSGEARIKKVV